MLSQIKSSSSNGSSTTQQQMMSIMSEAFHEAHLTLAHLALQSPVAPDDVDSRKAPSCPLVGETGSGGWDCDLMDKARDMLQPLLSHLSRELADELVKVIRDRLERGSSPQ